MKPVFPLITFLFVCQIVSSQIVSEDSLTVGGSKPATYLGGYGNVLYQNNKNEKSSEINLERAVFFVGHRFNEKFSFFSELEVEDAKVSGGEEGGEIALEQAYLKFNVSRNSYVTAGLFLPRIGILNENHLPNTFNGNERTLVETYLIPSTWRELGIGFYTRLNQLPVNLSIAVINGLNCEGFEHGTLIRDGRFEGREASANSIAVTGSFQYYKGNFTFQVSGYAGGSTAVSKEEADGLNLESGPFGTPVILGESNIQYKLNALNLKILGTVVSIPDASKINAAFNNNTPESAYGFYAEAAYDLLYKKDTDKKKSLNIFARFEIFDLNATFPDNAIDDETLNQNHLIAGLSYLPIPQIAIKADVRFSSTGEQNPLLADPADPEYKQNNTFINLGAGFSF